MKEKDPGNIIRNRIDARMIEQWEEASDMTMIDCINHETLWHQIIKITHKTSRRVLFFKIYSIAATVLLLFGLGSILFFYDQKSNTEVIYTVSTGIKNIHTVWLPDSTEVKLGPGSTLVYPEVFSSKIRSVELQGQGFFQVRKDPDKKFIVQTDNMKVEALGTDFEVFDYGDNSLSEAVLLNGKIKVTINSSEIKDKSEWLLSPDEKISFDKETDIWSLTKLNVDAYSGWRISGRPEFENEKLSVIISRLERWYGREIICDLKTAEKYRFTFKVRDEELETILYLMGLSSPIRFKEDDNGNYMLAVK